MLHNWLARWGVHVLRRQPSGKWVSEHHLAPVGGSTARRDFATRVDPTARYEREAADIRRSEIATVRARALAVRGAAEFTRLSSLLPFPLQTWFLSIPRVDGGRARLSAGLLLNAVMGVAVAACVLAGLTGGNSAARSLVGWLAFPLQVVGGVLYRGTQEFEPGPETLLRRSWRLQIIAVFVAGTTAAIVESVQAGRVTGLFEASLWLVLGLLFALGIYGYDRVAARWFASARLNDDSGAPHPGEPRPE